MSGNTQNRRNWTRSLTVVISIALAAVGIGYLVDVEAGKTDRLYLRNTAGAVLFDHGTHSRLVESCAKCHHDLYSAALATSCEECHDEEFEPAEFSHSDLKEIHNRDCSQCHQPEDGSEREEPASCRQCHPGVQPSETNTLGCTECHEDGYSSDMMDHDAYMDMEEHTCMGCHSPRSVSTAYHTNCSHCHLETSRERFTQADGEVQCGACHLR